MCLIAKQYFYIKKERCIMSKAVSRGQALQVSARVATQVNWDKLDGDHLQGEVIDLTPEEFGRRLTAFLKNGAKVVFGDLKIATASFDSVSFIGKGWKLVSKERDERSHVLTEVDFAKTELVSCLRGEETSINGECKLIRLKEEDRIRYGATVFMGLWQDYQDEKGNSILERLYREENITYMDFFGDVFLGPDGHRFVLYLYRNAEGEWDWSVSWLADDWDAGHVSVVALQVDS